MADPFRSDRSWRFEVDRADLWQRICATDEFATWWPWLHRFDATGGLSTSERWSCTVSPPLPYSVRFDVHFDLVDPARLVQATVTGDISGRARLPSTTTNSDVGRASCRRSARPTRSCAASG